MTRIIYNRIPKAGSSTMSALFTAMSKVNNFTVVNDGDYFPTYDTLHHKLASLPDNSLYINHCNYMDGLPAAGNYVWINVDREPVDRDQSLFYYEVSDVRGKHGEDALRARKEDPCGCALMEYDSCIKFLANTAGCESRLVRPGPSRVFFSVPPDEGRAGREVPGFTAEQAFEVARSKYLFVGLTEQLDLTVKALEKLLPRFFKGMHAHFHANPENNSTAAAVLLKNKTKPTNSKTHTVLNGAISTAARALVEAHNPGEVALYRNITKLFWGKISQLLPEEINFL
jgi:hypothetical protein